MNIISRLFQKKDNDSNDLLHVVSGCDFTVRELSDIARYIQRDKKETIVTTKRFKYLVEFQRKVTNRLREIDFAIHNR